MTLHRPRGLAARRDVRFLAAGLASAALVVSIIPPVMAAGTATLTTNVPGQVKMVKGTSAKLKLITRTAKVTVGQAVGAPVGVSQPEFPPEEKGDDANGPKHGNFHEGRAGALNIPVALDTPVTNPTTTQPDSASGVDGVSGTEMRYASPDGNRWNYSLEPPDQGICVGNGYLVEAVNGAVRIFNAGSGAPISDVMPTNAFLTLPNEFAGGPSIGDPRCLYDPQTGRFFFTSYVQWDAYGTVIAVSNSSNPLGTWTVYLAGDAGDGTLPLCQYACFPDYPQTGLDSTALWITNNEFDFGNPDYTPYAGVTMWGISKQLLITGDFVRYGFVIVSLGYQPDGNPIGFTLEPATAPQGKYDLSNGGTQYFMATRDMDGSRDNVIDVWGFRGTSWLNGAAVQPGLYRTQLTGQTYACEYNGIGCGSGAAQRPGPYPLGTSIGEPLPRLSTNDDRMHNVVYSNGKLWGAAATAMKVGSASAATTTGIAWWQVNASMAGPNGSVSASIARQGYVGAYNSFLFFPGIAVNPAGGGGQGSAIITMTMSSAKVSPSLAWIPLMSNGATPGIRIAKAGNYPADGFTGYPEFYPPGQWPGTERWGDYTAAATDERGMLYFAGEVTGKNSYPVANRAPYVNWGTWIGWVFPNW